MRRIEAGSYYSYLPEGCRICRKGAKLVLFITGLCHNKCFYCPISYDKIGKDVIFANEREVKELNDFIEELELMDAEGVAITGGEPMLKINRVLEFLNVTSRLGLHSHLYTTIPVKEGVLEKLKGLDEVRFHPPELKNARKYEESIKAAKKLGIEAGFEIPAIRFEKEIVEIANKLDAFLNVNQIEVSETNYKSLSEYKIVDYYVENEGVVKLYERANKFHYCSARFKDVAQFRRRLIRMALKYPEFYQVTKEGTLVCCYIEGEELEVAERLLKKGGFDYLRVEGGIEAGINVVDEIGEALKAEGFRLCIIERYPTSKRIVVEVIPV
jgi:hypothetical protein